MERLDMKKKYSDEQGFTLLEVMTSMLIMSFSLLVLLQMTMVALDGNTWASGTTSSTQLMQEKLEELRSNSNPESGEDTIGNITLTWTVADAGSHLRQINMTAFWLTPDSVTRTYNINTFMKTDSI